jgi:hypothetical protein
MSIPAALGVLRVCFVGLIPLVGMVSSAAWADDLAVQVGTGVGRSGDTLRVQFRPDASGTTIAGKPEVGTDLRRRLSSLWAHSRSTITALKADVDSLNRQMSEQGLTQEETRAELDRIRERRADARVSLNALVFLNRVAADSTRDATWGETVHRQEAVLRTPSVLVVNRTRTRMAVDVWDADSVRVSYVPVFAGFRGESLPSDGALARLAEVRSSISRCEGPEVGRLAQTRILLNLRPRGGRCGQ